MTFVTPKSFLIAGPCVVETEKICFETAKRLIDITSGKTYLLYSKHHTKKPTAQAVNLSVL